MVDYHVYMVDFSGIRTLIVGVAGKLAYQFISTTDPFVPNLIDPLRSQFRLEVHLTRNLLSLLICLEWTKIKESVQKEK